MVPGSSHLGNVGLTFDDGPHPEYTPRILATLDRFNAKAVFFLQGDQAEKHPELVKQIFETGHQLGNHAYNHPHLRELSATQYIAEVENTQTLLDQIVGQSLPKLFRPPYGELGFNVTPRLMVKGYRHILWSHDSRDSFIKDASELTNHVKSFQMNGGEILLFHDDYRRTVEILNELLLHWQELGCRTVLI